MKKIFILFGIIFIILIVGCVQEGQKPQSGPQSVEIRQPADLTQLTFLDHASDPDWSPDGSQIIFEGTDEGETGLYLINVDGTGLTKIGSGHNPSWSPVDNRILYRKDDPCCSLILIDLDGDLENKVELASQIKEQGSWSPDGEKIVYSIPDGTESSSIWVMNSDGSGKTRLTTDEDGFCMVPSFSYDGSKIVYLKGLISYAPGAAGMDPNEVWTMNVDGTNKQKIYAPGNSAQLIFQRAWNKDNKITFMKTWYRGPYPQIWVMNSDGSDPELIVSAETEAFGDPVWNNAGNKIACSKTPPQTTMGSNIWIFSYEAQ